MELISETYELERYVLEAMHEKGICVTMCGHQISNGGWKADRYIHWNYSIHFVLDGRGKVIIDNKEYCVEKGQGFLVFPDIPVEYEADREGSWTYFYVDFNGTDAENLVERMGMSKEKATFEYVLDDEMMSMFEKMLSAAKENLCNGYDVLGYFMIAVGNVMKQNNKSNKTTSQEEYIHRARSYIKNNLNNDISIKDVANFVSVDRTHLYRLFMTQLGISPSEYLLNTRLKRAVFLMSNGNLSIKEIARSVGFYDLQHFSRFFTKKMGVSPKKYRESIKRNE